MDPLNITTNFLSPSGGRSATKTFTAISDVAHEADAYKRYLTASFIPLVIRTVSTLTVVKRAIKPITSSL